MKSFFALLLVFISSQAMASKVECLSASGYYGNISLVSNAGGIHIVAAQGFAHELSSQLGLNDRDSFYELDIRLPQRACDKNLECQFQNASVVGRTYEKSVSFKADVGFKIIKLSSMEGHYQVILAIGSALQEYEFGNLGGCTFKK